MLYAIFMCTALACYPASPVIYTQKAECAKELPAFYHSGAAETGTVRFDCLGKRVESWH